MGLHFVSINVSYHKGGGPYVSHKVRSSLIPKNAPLKTILKPICQSETSSMTLQSMCPNILYYYSFKLFKTVTVRHYKDISNESGSSLHNKSS